MSRDSGPSERFDAFLAEGRFMLQRCRVDGGYVFYPRVLCPSCGSSELEWVAASGRGTVYSTTVVRRKVESGGDYNIALIDLAEGPRMMSRVEGMAPEAVQIGMPVEAEIRQDPSPVIVFRAAEQGHDR